MGGQDTVTNEIMEERLDIAFEIVQEKLKKFNLKISDYEKLDIVTRIANALFIEKNKQYRVSKMYKE